ncbi:TetR/AcrR family transcriptional regulator [Phytoactinopolyspora halotolerans]|uniref:TetR/AcrR family transcriptional regulator n=1 Tax=Phytoactinopolyspora halotolerans TaxID=1981512 RepID=A0A6L9SGB3_9ACTN|nr:TetR/AcrR family transcriptional regulator [Phytoactinopolyspora halotolerans]NEE04173.1 TetR/AcrR family transcriptional regulator [Phytoactinopolyspora halotolerans]
MSTDEAPTKGRVAKRQAILEATRAVLAHTGYAGTSIDSIAHQAQVSTRTIYNHFGSKDDLVNQVLVESTTTVADALTELIDQHLDRIRGTADLEDALVDLGCDWVRLQDRYADHFSLVRRLDAAGEQLPADVYAAWHATGPERAQATLARHLRLLRSEGLLSFADPERAASHYIYLALGEALAEARRGGVEAEPTAIAALVRAGVHAFLHGHLPRPSAP